MNACLSDFRVVNPTLRTFSAAEARIAQSSIRFNNLSAAELGYPENVRLLISSEGTTLAIQACDKDDPCAVPFMSGRTAEDLKIKIGSCYKRAEVDYMDVRGRNLVTGLPKTVKVSSEETEEALRETTAQIVETIHSVLEKTPPELAADIADRGIVLTGGGSLLRGLEDLISAKTGINTMTAEDPMTAVAIGTGKYVEFLAGNHDDKQM